MAITPITEVIGKAVPIPGDDIDTDRIIPARFMKCVTFDDLAEGMFYDVRFNTETGEETNHPLNQAKHKEATIILSGANFGCGSSREHAPQSIYKYGLRAIIAESFAEIFFGNSTTLGMPCVTASRNEIEKLAKYITERPETVIAIDLNTRQAKYDNITFPIEIPESAHSALTSGRYDPLQELLENSPSIDKTAKKLSYI